MTYKEKEELAMLLYTRGVVTHQGELAQRVGVSEVTISRWKTKAGWDNVKKSMLVSRQEQMSLMYDQLEELNAKIKDRPKGERYAHKGEADTLVKLTAAIRNLETELNIADIIDVMTDFSEFVRKIDLDKAKELIELQDAFVKSHY